ncbi:hypothetical protein BDP27DRAFT_1365474 [Rhodocollybia butyracea]|uniref:Uncharacterized protein n=1 Tax=Rhodocollybia butyracea TaxID=206335 RepID=A0A9P5PP64_9AGAR|nr:hypothetical protein BDP27DRAFT_1365474 [Rhodocollybia butyracea]
MIMTPFLLLALLISVEALPQPFKASAWASADFEANPHLERRNDTYFKADHLEPHSGNALVHIPAEDSYSEYSSTPPITPPPPPKAPTPPTSGRYGDRTPPPPPKAPTPPTSGRYGDRTNRRPSGGNRDSNSRPSGGNHDSNRRPSEGNRDSNRLPSGATVTLILVPLAVTMTLIVVPLRATVTLIVVPLRATVTLIVVPLMVTVTLIVVPPGATVVLILVKISILHREAILTKEIGLLTEAMDTMLLHHRPALRPDSIHTFKVPHSPGLLPEPMYIIIALEVMVPHSLWFTPYITHSPGLHTSRPPPGAHAYYHPIGGYGPPQPVFHP